MDSAEVVVEEEDRQSVFVVLSLFAESVGQPRHPSHPHSDAQVVSFDMRRANQGQIGESADAMPPNVHYCAWRVPDFRSTRRVAGRRRGLYCNVSSRKVVQRLGQHLIVASARAGGATQFYSHDKNCRTLAELAGMEALDLPNGETMKDQFLLADIRAGKI